MLDLSIFGTLIRDIVQVSETTLIDVFGAMNDRYSEQVFYKL